MATSKAIPRHHHLLLPPSLPLLPFLLCVSLYSISLLSSAPPPPPSTSRRAPPSPKTITPRPRPIRDGISPPAGRSRRTRRRLVEAWRTMKLWLPRGLEKQVHLLRINQLPVRILIGQPCRHTMALVSCHQHILPQRWLPVIHLRHICGVLSL